MPVVEHETEIAEIAAPLGALLEAQTRGEIDIQVSTAKRFPRSIRQFNQELLEMATLDENIAAQCFYALPRDGKTIEGPSARFAELAASAWGHMRIEGRIVNEDDRFVTGRGVSWDMQRNVAIAYEVRRRITNKHGKRYTDDMITVTGNAASSIALRNAILKNIPKPFWEPAYLAARLVAVGNAQTLADRRAAMLAYFQKMGAPPARVFATLGVQGEQDITLDQLATLKGLATAIKEGDTTVDQAFPLDGQAGPTPTRQSASTNGQAADEKPTHGITAPVVITAAREAKAQRGQPKRWEITAGTLIYSTTDEALQLAAVERMKAKTPVLLHWTLGEPFGRVLEQIEEPAPVATTEPTRQREPGDDDEPNLAPAAGSMFK